MSYHGISVQVGAHLLYWNPQAQPGVNIRIDDDGANPGTGDRIALKVARSAGTTVLMTVCSASPDAISFSSR